MTAESIPTRDVLPLVMFVIGGPGSGKGTQVRIYRGCNCTFGLGHIVYSVQAISYLPSVCAVPMLLYLRWKRSFGLVLLRLDLVFGFIVRVPSSVMCRFHATNLLLYCYGCKSPLPWTHSCW